MAVVGAINHYREWLICRDPMRMGALWQEMYRSQYFEGGRVLTAAIAAIDIALYDIAGKALGVPVYQLLGGKHREWIPCFATMWGSSRVFFIELGFARVRTDGSGRLRTRFTLYRFVVCPLLVSLLAPYANNRNELWLHTQLVRAGTKLRSLTLQEIRAQ